MSQSEKKQRLSRKDLSDYKVLTKLRCDDCGHVTTAVTYNGKKPLARVCFRCNSDKLFIKDIKLEKREDWIRR